MSRSVATGGIVLALATAVAGCGGSGAGPFAWPKDAGTTVSGVAVRPGQFGVTAVYLLGTADKAAVLLDVRPQHPEDADGLTIRYAASTGRGMHLGGDRGWHPARWDLRRLVGFVIPAHSHASVVVGAAAAKPGIYLLRGFIVDYRIGSSRYSAPQQHGLQVCVGKPCPQCPLQPESLG